VLVVGPERGLELEFEIGRAQTVPDYAPARASGSGSGYHANTIPVADDVDVAASRQTNTHAHAYPCANNCAVALTGVQVQVQVRVRTLSHPDVVPTACAFEWVARMLGSDSDSGSAVDAKVRKGGTGCAAHG
jgi:hypothetical protein